MIFSPGQIAATVCRLAREIAWEQPGEPLLLVGVLEGARYFTVDLARALASTTEVCIEVLTVSSYGKSMRSSGEMRLIKDVREGIEGKHVVIVDDIIDNGLTL